MFQKLYRSPAFGIFLVTLFIVGCLYLWMRINNVSLLALWYNSLFYITVLGTTLFIWYLLSIRKDAVEAAKAKKKEEEERVAKAKSDLHEKRKKAGWTDEDIKVSEDLEKQFEAIPEIFESFFKGGMRKRREETKK